MGEGETAVSFHLHWFRFLWAHQPRWRVQRKQGALSPKLLTIIRDDSAITPMDFENLIHQIFSMHPLCVKPQWLLDVPSSNRTPFTQQGYFTKILTKIPNRIPFLTGIFFPSLEIRLLVYGYKNKIVSWISCILIGWKWKPPCEILKLAMFLEVLCCYRS